MSPLPGQALLRHPRLPLILAALGMTLTLPSLGGGLALDDWFHRARLLGGGPFPTTDRPLLEYFAMVPREGDYARALRPVMAWWQAPEVEITLWRPVSVLTHLLDAWLWPDAFPLQHLHSILWYGLAVAAVAWTCRQVSASAVVAGLAALLFAVEDAHGMPVGWLANRNALVALVFGTLALGFHVRWRRGGRWRDAGASWLLLALGLLAGESALGAVAYLAAWEAWGARDGWRRRLASLAPAALLVGAWRAAYVGLGFRTVGSGLYIDPGREPLAFLRAALERAPSLLLAQWFQVQVDMILAVPRSVQVAVAVFGTLGVLVLVPLFARTLREDAEARVWATGMVLALIPPCATFPMDRLLTFVGLGAFGLLAVQVRRMGWLDLPADVPAGRPLRILTGVLLALFLGTGVLLLPLRSLSPRFLYGAVEQSAIVPADASIRQQTWVYLNALDLFVMYIPIIRPLSGLEAPRGVETLACHISDLEVRRPDDRTLEVAPRPGFLAWDIERLVRSAEIPFTPGQRIRRDRMEVEVVEVLDDGRPARVRFHFDTSLDDPSIRWFQADRLAGAPWVPPRVGEEVVVPGIVSSLRGL